MLPTALRRLVVPVVVAAVAVLLPVAPAGSSPPPAPDGVFTLLPGFDPSPGARSRVVPREARAYRVDLGALGRRLAAAPSERAVRGGAAPLRLSVPGPGGGLVRFDVQETRVMQAGLARRHPELRTYAGRGVTDPTTTIRLDLTPMGFHASVRSLSGTRAWYVDPAFDRPGTTTHLVYRRAALPAPDRPLVEPDLEELVGDGVAPARAGEAPGAPVQRRTYRLAFVTDPTYATYFGTANVLAEKVTLMNRVNQLYNDDLAIRMLLVDGTEALNLDTAAKATGPDGPCGASPCYEAADLDPETGGCTGALLDRTEFVLGQLIGADKFDIGHIGLGINGGGVAGLGVVGEASKASGCTGLPKPQGDFYAVDYVAHEMGHQFGGPHTFNGTLVNCSLTNRSGGSSVEPGSGSSVMAYAGICGRDDLQEHSDPYFSQRSIDEITAHVTGAPSAYDEQQVVNLRGFDTDAEQVRLTAPGKSPVTLTRGSLTYNALTIASAVQTLTGVLPEVSGYDGALSPDDAGFTLDFTVAGSGTDIPTLGVEGVSPGVSGFVGTTYNGGPGTNRGTIDVQSGNRAPGVTAPADKTLPVRTPFALTATGSDVDGHPLVYLWEQNDEGPTAPNGGTPLLSNTKTNGPLFRVFGTAATTTDEQALQTPAQGLNAADGGPTRTFPDLHQVLAGNTNAATGSCPAPPAEPAAVPRATVDCYSEFLPTADYGSPVLGGSMTFRVTARDLVAAGGGTAHDDVTLTVDRTAGPFAVTSRATAGQPAEGGASETVTWQVNGTDAASLAPDVRILLSTDGGLTWPRVLLATTPNDGSQAVTLPAIDTETARIRVEAVGNYFFDVNDANFAIDAALSLAEVEPGTAQHSDGLDDPVTVVATSLDTDGDQITGSVDGLEGLELVPGDTSGDGVRPGTREFIVTGEVLEAPGVRTGAITVTTGGADPDTAETPLEVTVRPEDAWVVFAAPGSLVSEDSPATVTLQADVGEAGDDGSLGRVDQAEVTFVDRDTGQELCSAPVVGSSPDGTATCEAELANEGGTTTYTIGMIVGGTYVRDDPADDAELRLRRGPGDPPSTRITRGPDNGWWVFDRRATFRYAGSEDATSFRCSLDGARVGCGPDGRVTFKRLASGRHVFRVAARDASGQLDPTPARRVFGVPLPVGAFKRSDAWTVRKDKHAYDGRWLRSTQRGAVLSRRLTGVRTVALLVGMGPGYGSVEVRFRGRLVHTVGLENPREHTRFPVEVASFGRKRSGLLTVRTVDDRPVRIEGLGIL